MPLVSDPVSPSVCSAASAPPEFTLSEVVKYELPRFFGITKTLSPVFTLPPDAAVAEDEEEAAGDEAAAEVAGAVVDEEEDEDDEQAATAGATNKSGRASHVARLSLMVCILSIFGWMFG